MARKLSLSELRDSSVTAQVVRLLGSLQTPLSPEGRRVLKAADAGLKLIRNSQVHEENFPDSIRALLKQHREEPHPTEPLRPDHS